MTADYHMMQPCMHARVRVLPGSGLYGSVQYVNEYSISSASDAPSADPTRKCHTPYEYDISSYGDNGRVPTPHIHAIIIINHRNHIPIIISVPLSRHAAS